MTPVYFCSMPNMLLGMCGNERYIYLILRYIYFILIELRLKLISLFLQDLETIKYVNHATKILNLEHNEDTWFQDVVCYFRLAALCATIYKIINHGRFLWRYGTKRRHLYTFLVERCQSLLVMSHAFCIFRLREDY